MKTKIVLAIIFLLLGSASTFLWRGDIPSQKGKMFVNNFTSSLEDSLLTPQPNIVEIGEREVLPVQVSGSTPEVKKISKPAPIVKKNPTVTAPKKPVIEKSPMPSSTTNVASSSIKEPWCSWKTNGLPQRDVLINEIAWMGSLNDPEAEWIELKNAKGWEVDVGGWQLIGQQGKIKIRLTGKNLQAGEFYILSHEVPEPEVKGDLLYKGDLRNGGEWLKLFGPDCRFMDEVKADNGWQAGNKKLGLTMEKKVAVEGWQSSREEGGSPGKQNYIELIFASTTVSDATPILSIPLIEEGGVANANIVIASLQIYGTASDDDRVTLYNSGPDSVDVSGWKLRKKTKSGSESSIKTLAGEIGGYGYFVWANSKYPTGADATSTQTISADNSIALLNAENILVDAIAWGSGHTNPYIEGFAFPQNPKTGEVLQRKKVAEVLVDSGDNSADFEISI